MFPNLANNSTQRDFSFNNISSQQSAKIPVFDNGILPPSGASQQGLIAFEKGLSPLQNTTGSLEYFDGTAWIANTGDITLDVVGTTPNTKGASLIGGQQKLQLQPADDTYPGVLTAGAQTIGGLKYFKDNLTVFNAGSLPVLGDNDTLNFVKYAFRLDFWTCGSLSDPVKHPQDLQRINNYADFSSGSIGPFTVVIPATIVSTTPLPLWMRPTTTFRESLVKVTVPTGNQIGLVRVDTAGIITIYATLNYGNFPAGACGVDTFTFPGIFVG